MPAIWKKVNIEAIPKIKPRKSVTQDIRPTSLTPTISKVFESLVGKCTLDAIGDKLDINSSGSLHEPCISRYHAYVAQCFG